MKTGSIAICGLTVIPVRAEHADPSEIVTQLLFGEYVECIDHHDQWVKVKILHDEYIGWVDEKQLLVINQGSNFHYNSNTPRQQEDQLEIHTPWGIQAILKGSPVLSNDSNFKIDKYSFSWTKQSPSLRESNVFNIAVSYLNAPYLWGGRTKFGIDCSGFSQTVFHQLGFNLNRDASQQVLQGEEINFEEQRTGDLAFFASEKTGNITHVGIILSDFKIIHAHGRIRIDQLDKTGIFNEEKAYYSHKLFNIKRYKL